MNHFLENPCLDEANGCDQRWSGKLTIPQEYMPPNVTKMNAYAIRYSASPQREPELKERILQGRGLRRPLRERRQQDVPRLLLKHRDREPRLPSLGLVRERPGRGHGRRLRFSQRIFEPLVDGSSADEPTLPFLIRSCVSRRLRELHVERGLLLRREHDQE